ncbi:hypothetical protein [Methylobacterium sp. CM6244]
MSAGAEASTDPLVLSLQQAIDEAERRRDAQIALIASLADQEGRQAQAWEVLAMIEGTLRQAQQNYAVVKSLSEPE